MSNEKIHPADNVHGAMADHCPCRKQSWCLDCLHAHVTALRNEIMRLRATPICVQQDDPIAAYLEASGFRANLLEWSVVAMEFRKHGVGSPDRFSLQHFDKGVSACHLTMRWTDEQVSASWMAKGASGFVPGLTITRRPQKRPYGYGDTSESISSLTPDLAARLLAIFLTPEGQVASHGE